MRKPRHLAGFFLSVDADPEDRNRPTGIFPECFPPFLLPLPVTTGSEMLILKKSASWQFLSRQKMVSLTKNHHCPRFFCSARDIPGERTSSCPGRSGQIIKENRMKFIPSAQESV